MATVGDFGVVADKFNVCGVCTGERRFSRKETKPIRVTLVDCMSTIFGMEDRLCDFCHLLTLSAIHRAVVPKF